MVMISRSKKKVEDPESDSDWDSLPGDVPEPSSSPDSKPQTTPASSLSPVPPKQPNTPGLGKHHGATKPLSIYKNSLNASKKTGSATIFEDKSGGLWNNDDEADKFHFLKESNNNNNMKDSSKFKSKKEQRDVQGQESQKRPPFTDFRDALNSPIPTSHHPQGHHELSGVNQAYRIDKGDGVGVTNHDSWDDSEIEPASQLQESYICQKGKDVLATKQEHEADNDPKQQEKSKRIKQDKSKFGSTGLNLVLQGSDIEKELQFEKCCLIQATHGPYDDRYRPSFFHGSKDHFHIKEDDPRATVTGIAEKSEVMLQRFWREVFGVLQILINVLIIFILEFFKVVVHSLQVLINGILYIIGDHFIKPTLSAIFNNIIQPFSILLLNIFTIFTNLIKPVLTLTREIFIQVSIPLKAFRLFELNWDQNNRKDRLCTDVKVI